MPVSGLVITLRGNGDDARAAARQLAAHGAITLGEAQGRKLPVAVDTSSRTEDKRVWEWLQSHPGIEFVDVISVYFDEDIEEDGEDQGTEAGTSHSSHSMTSGE